MTKDSMPSVTEQSMLAEHVRSGRGLMVALDDPEIAADLRGGVLEEVLPVRLDPPQRDGRDVSLVLLVDRSGSMDESDAARTPLDLAMEAAGSVASLLTDGDRLGLIAFDVRPHVIRALGPVSKPVRAREPFPAIDPEGGTDWAPALHMALDWLEEDNASIRHVVLVSDGRLAPEAQETPARAWPEGVTLSTVAVGERIDADRLRNLADRFGGRYRRATGPEDLPAALRKECARVGMPVRIPVNGTVRSETEFAALHGDLSVVPQTPLLSVTSRPGTEIALRTDRGDPVLLFGKAGWGAVAFLAVAPGSLVLRETGTDASEGILESALARVSGAGWDLPAETSLQRVRGTLALEHVPDDPSETLPQVRVRFPSGKIAHMDLNRVAPGRARGSISVSEEGEYVVQAGGTRSRYLLEPSPERASLPFDPEWARRLGTRGKGRILSLDAAEETLFPHVEPGRKVVDAAPMLVALAAVLLLADSVLHYWRAGRRQPT
jgi:Mg-chelatase subunit ChlD